jgi:hypothetical protein
VDKKYPAMMTWQQMRSMQGDLVQFYNHTMTHPYLLDLNKTQIKTQITHRYCRCCANNAGLMLVDLGVESEK